MARTQTATKSSGAQCLGDRLRASTSDTAHRLGQQHESCDL